jgi:hypothetical protein
MRLMDDAVIVGHLENLDRRLARVEQFLPTLATKEELRLGIAPLATKEELRLAIAAAVAPLATKEELRLAIAPLATRQELDEKAAELLHEIREEGQRSRRHMDVLIEGQHGDIQLIAEHLSVVMSRLTDT